MTDGMMMILIVCTWATVGIICGFLGDFLFNEGLFSFDKPYLIGQLLTDVFIASLWGPVLFIFLTICIFEEKRFPPIVTKFLNYKVTNPDKDN